MVVLSVVPVLWASSNLWAKDIDLSVSGFVGYDYSTWKGAIGPRVTGTHHDSSLAYGGSIQAIYNRWKFQPTFEFSFKRERFDFTDLQLRISKNQPDFYSFRLGLTKDLSLFHVYGLLGYSLVHNNVEFHALNDPFNGRHVSPTSNLFSVKFGVYKMFTAFDIFGDKLKVGPEISAEIFPRSNSFNVPRKFKSLNIVPNGGIRFHW